jgi:CHAD domain-containing protein
MSSRSYRLQAEESAAAGMRRIALGRAEAARDQLAGAGGTALAAAIHDARKDLKKLRAVVRLVRDELGENLFKVENRRYRDAGRKLSRSRDAEVKLEILAALRDRFAEDLPGDAAEHWESALEAERDEVADVVRGEAATSIGAALKAVEQGREQILAWPVMNDSWDLVGPGLATSYRQGRRAMKRVLTDPDSANVHRWRKRTKDLWYQLRIVREAWPELLGATAGQAHELADLLGDHHDLALLVEDLAHREGVGERRALAALFGRRQGELLGRALEIGGRLYAEKPKAFDRRLKRYWLAWRGV